MLGEQNHFQEALEENTRQTKEGFKELEMIRLRTVRERSDLMTKLKLYTDQQLILKS